jgi:hypothetical protein
MLLIVTVLGSGIAFPSGFGWYVSSFDWSDFQRLSPRLETIAGEQSKADRIPLDNPHRYGALIQILNVRMGASSPVPLVDESPIDNEFYWPDALRYASQVQEKRRIKSFFALFSKGRSLWPSTESEACGKAFYCYDSYVILSPDEVAAFQKEVVALNSKTRHPDDYVDYLDDIEILLTKVSREHRALFFQGHD